MYLHIIWAPTAFEFYDFWFRVILMDFRKVKCDFHSNVLVCDNSKLSKQGTYFLSCFQYLFSGFICIGMVFGD